MAGALPPLDDEDNPINDELLKFYRPNLRILTNVFLSEIDPMQLRQIACMLHTDSKSFGEDWRKYAYNCFGIKDYYALDEIELSAECNKELPLYIVLERCIHEGKNVAQIIAILISLKKYHILKRLKSYIQTLVASTSTPAVPNQVANNTPPLSTASSTETCKNSRTAGTHSSSKNSPEISFIESSIKNKNYKFDSVQKFPTNSHYLVGTQNKKAGEVNLNVQSQQSISADSSKKSIEYKSSFCGNSNSNKECETSFVASGYTAKKPELDSTQKCSASAHFAGSKRSKPFSEVCIDVKPEPSAPLGRGLCVLVMHTSQDAPIANLLTDKLIEENISVETLSQNEHFTMIDQMGALSYIFQKVDFIVPVVSPNFLYQVLPQDSANYNEANEFKYNRILYQLLTEEYIRNRCLNLRVRPVLIPGFDRRLLNNNLVLSAALRLWTEVPKLVQVLWKTREIFLNSRNN